MPIASLSGLAIRPPVPEKASDAGPCRNPTSHMLAKLRTFSLLGIDALPVEVEVDVSPSGLPKTVLVGLLEQAVKESTHRVERALVNSGFELPRNRIALNLARACSRLNRSCRFPQPSETASRRDGR